LQNIILIKLIQHLHNMAFREINIIPNLLKNRSKTKTAFALEAEAVEV